MKFNPPTLTIDSMARLTNVPDALMVDVIRMFTLENPTYKEAVKKNRKLDGIPTHLRFFSFEGNGLSFPKGAVRRVLELCQRKNYPLAVKDNRVSGKALEAQLTFKGELRGYQKEASNAALEHDFGVVEAATGSGKTVIACNVIAQRSVNTIISCPSIELMNQWVSRLQAFVNIDEIGVIGDGRYSLKPITVAVINSLNKHAADLSDYFEFLVVDEAHRVGSEMYIGGPMTKLKVRYMLGLSATLMRGDGLIDLLYWFVGRRIHTVDPKHLREIDAVMKPMAVQVQTVFNSRLAEKSYAKMIGAMTENLSRNELIAENVIADTKWKEAEGRAKDLVLVVSDRVEHLKVLSEIIANRIGKEKVAVLTGQTKKTERRKIVEDLEKGVITTLLSSLSLISEGFDCKMLASVHLATPIADRKRIIQVVGRILRPEEGKKPIIVDYVDKSIGMLEYRAGQRVGIFQKDIFATMVKETPWATSMKPNRQDRAKDKQYTRAPQDSKAPHIPSPIKKTTGSSKPSTYRKSVDVQHLQYAKQPNLFGAG